MWPRMTAAIMQLFQQLSKNTSIWPPRPGCPHREEQPKQPLPALGRRGDGGYSVNWRRCPPSPRWDHVWVQVSSTHSRTCVLYLGWPWPLIDESERPRFDTDDQAHHSGPGFDPEHEFISSPSIWTWTTCTFKLLTKNLTSHRIIKCHTGVVQ